ncbi:hypothetical protein CLAFUW4_05650 [Fulvia fulva]|uniref:Uncharacterized protein n=1 Tax=Passalora fulva TaxID=5499 RepID=A0A9Q8P9A2_PASFU|nr:uncharacterized protein CLAFUR5_05791 [Fulvia fulva]KAK4623766.1 hypothetical protein CLAFUR4_05645 [Fulvia fulva]KAK4625110.1 hypothetical protein CLAFUR0_05653 [Fulvia fulva]UJO18075.1 hypothetical protein CLAFUR5_05791 [Fulvia fulva]WPV15548.1 hypothetical protein CLAFUW4_05650 [Fulvia fulva]WPV29781.1 hypothetical protein CLAFUW7_05649 [Fulvia fulva]
MNIVQELQRHPLDDRAEKMWQNMSDNYQARRTRLHQANFLFLKYLGKTILQAWEATEAAMKQKGMALEEPQIVLDIKHNLGEVQDDSNLGQREPSGIANHTLQDNTEARLPDVSAVPYFTNSLGMESVGYREMFETTMSGFGTDWMDCATIFGM